MNEAEARAWVRDRFGVSRETSVAAFETLLREEAVRQNLVALPTLDEVWGRHLTDSAQLVPFAESSPDGVWVDVGSGAGLPGIIVALLTDRPVVMVEPRAKRVEFLRDVIESLDIASRASVIQGKIQRYQPPEPAAIVSARAVAALGDLFASTVHCTDSSTVWLLPKGRNAQSEVEAARRNWQGVFHVEPSITQPDSGIVIARKVRAR